MSDQAEMQSMHDAMEELDRRAAARGEEEAEAEEDAEQLGADESDPLEDEDVADEKPEGEEDEPAPEKFTLTVDGQQVDASRDELVEYAQKGIDYTRKTQEVAKEREEVSQARAYTSRQIQSLQQQAQALAQMAQSVIGQEPGIDLAATDPQTYLVQQAMYRQRAEAYQHLVSQAQGLQQQSAQLDEAQTAERLREEFKAATRVIPELADPVKKRAFTDKAIAASEKYGFTAADVQAIQDHRMLLILKDLTRLQELDAQTKTVRKKLDAAPPKVVNSAPAKAPGEQNTTRSKDAKRDFLKSGRSMKDVERWIRNTSR